MTRTTQSSERHEGTEALQDAADMNEPFMSVRGGKRKAWILAFKRLHNRPEGPERAVTGLANRRASQVHPYPLTTSMDSNQ